MSIAEPRMTLSELAAELDALDETGWRRLIEVAGVGGVGGDRWDEAWERVLAAGHGTTAVEFAASWRREMPVTARAAIAGAAAALIAGPELEAAEVEALLDPLRGSPLALPAPAAASHVERRRQAYCPWRRGAAITVSMP